MAADSALPRDKQIWSGGVPQRSILGTLMLVVAHLDLPTTLQTATGTNYADHTKLSQAINIPNIINLQNDLSAIYR